LNENTREQPEDSHFAASIAKNTTRESATHASSSRLIASHRIASYRIVSHRIAWRREKADQFS
jgi:hypothetical protein